MSSSWEKLRSDFPITKKYTFLDHASGGVISTPVYERALAHQKSLLEEGDFAWLKWMKFRDTARAQLAEFINASPEEIAFTTSASDGMNQIAELIASEGKVLTNDLEFPTSTLPWIWRDASMVYQKSQEGAVDIGELESLLSPEIKTLVSSFVQYKTGYRQDLERLGKIKGDRFFAVNATQGFGVLPVDVKKWDADFLCANSYKWMMAGYGGGILYIKKKWLDKYKPSSIGWRSMHNPDAMDNRKIDMRSDAERYERGCPSFATIFNLSASVEYLMSIGMEKIEKRVLELTDFAIEGLEKQGFEIVTPRAPEARSGIVVFKIKDAVKVWQRLLKQGIYVSPRGEGMRIAPHFYNTFEEIEKFLKAIK